MTLKVFFKIIKHNLSYKSYNVIITINNKLYNNYSQSQQINLNKNSNKNNKQNLQM